MKKKDAINVAFYQSVFYLIIGLALGLVPWQEHRYILAIIVLALFIAAHYIAKYSIEELDDAMQYNHKKER
ncbi:hypothetical protein LI139_01945 [Veillonella atypica]|jgi:hypothetical protein|uniref:hypothetical protein n=1 Tax=Veillonella atypica TaxID=39777 RepID=UPI001D06DC15|nr:hypothetical protein [Veillonella atypica]MDU3553552.1 hypothetical protein [Clostridium perfringens]MDU3629461.1 hypothetical protein [Bacteroides caccae]DAD64895.1 MAG TPA: hypothetical protein [Caudoviricetes sp.]MCB6514401.1 hypothetical protein [Veillonella atypica]DAE50050.1 MAG TPA: hypothetical protein [Caudoviricetes sp.]